MKKKLIIAAMAAALAATSGVTAFGASPTTNVTIPSSSDGSGAWTSPGDRGRQQGGTGQTGTGSRGTAAEQAASRLLVPTDSGTATHSGGRAVVADTAIEFVQGSQDAVIGLPQNVVASINSINSGADLSQAGTGLDLNGYYALVGTTAVMTYDAVTNTEKTGSINVPLYVPNLIDGLGTVQVLYYNNMTGQWQLLTPYEINAADKMVCVTIPGSGTFSVVYKR